jgi:ethanolamine utilization microcompartment shell protein EutS
VADPTRGTAPAGIPPGSALGLVETHGLVAAIEAADAMLKAADVTLVRKHRVDPGMISHIVVGETSAVQAAVDAGVAAAQRLGRIYGSLVIPRPSDDVWRAMLGVAVGESASAAAAPAGAPPSPGDTRGNGTPADAESAGDEATDTTDGPVPATAPPERDYDAMPVRELRALARSREGLDLRGRAVATAAKGELVAALRAADAR